MTGQCCPRCDGHGRHADSASVTQVAARQGRGWDLPLQHPQQPSGSARGDAGGQQPDPSPPRPRIGHAESAVRGFDRTRVLKKIRYAAQSGVKRAPPRFPFTNRAGRLPKKAMDAATAQFLNWLATEGDKLCSTSGHRRTTPFLTWTPRRAWQHHLRLLRLEFLHEAGGLPPGPAARRRFDQALEDSAGSRRRCDRPGAAPRPRRCCRGGRTRTFCRARADSRTHPGTFACRPAYSDPASGPGR